MKAVAVVAAVVAALCGPSVLAEPQYGDIPPANVGVTPDGAPVTVGQPGPATVVSFWATWCKYCLKEIDVLNKIQNAGGDRVRVLMVNIEEEDVFRAVVKKLAPLKLKIALMHDRDGKAKEAYGVGAIPHLFIIGRDGRVVSVYRGYSEKELDAIIADINLAMNTAPAAGGGATR